MVGCGIITSAIIMEAYGRICLLAVSQLLLVNIQLSDGVSLKSEKQFAQGNNERANIVVDGRADGEPMGEGDPTTPEVPDTETTKTGEHPRAGRRKNNRNRCRRGNCGGHWDDEGHDHHNDDWHHNDH